MKTSHNKKKFTVKVVYYRDLKAGDLFQVDRYKHCEVYLKLEEGVVDLDNDKYYDNMPQNRCVVLLDGVFVTNILMEAVDENKEEGRYVI